MTPKYLPLIVLFLSVFLQAIFPQAITAGWIIEDDILIIDDETDSIPAFQFHDNTIIRKIRFTPRHEKHRLKIGAYAFLGCSQLKEVELPDFVDELGEGCFRECSALEYLILPKRLTSTPRYMAAWCENLTVAVLPDSIEKIGAHSFAYCSSIEKIELPEHLCNIENNAFSRCASLQSIYIPDSVTALESYAFSDCFNLQSARLPQNGSLLGELIFSGCHSLIEITEPSQTVPEFDCNSSLFEPDDTTAYNHTLLRVPEISISSYRKAPGWNLLKNIRSIREE